MKNTVRNCRSKRALTFVGGLSLLLGLSAACGQKNSSDDAPAAAAPTQTSSSQQSVTPASAAVTTSVATSTQSSTAAGAAPVQYIHFGDPNTWLIGIGSSQIFKIPEGMHLVKFATTKSLNTTLDTWEVEGASDPANAQTTLCERNYVGSSQVPVVSTPNGKPYTYCHSTPRPADFAFSTNFSMGLNAIQAATDGAAPGTGVYESMTVSVFNGGFDFVHNKTAFSYLCGPGSTGVWSRGVIAVPIQNQYWAGLLPSVGAFQVCQAQINLGPFGQLTEWIGSVRIPTNGMTGSYMTEYVYVSDVNGTTANEFQFVQNAQVRILASLNKSQP